MKKVNKQGLTATSVAAESGAAQAIRLLIEADLNLDPKLLHYACQVRLLTYDIAKVS